MTQLQLGRPIVKSFTWSKIGEIDGNDLYLCDTALTDGRFGESHDYMSSAVRKKCLEIYNECFSDDERALLVKHPKLGDPVFLLGKDEYIEHRYAIKPMGSYWWLRSPGGSPDVAAFVGVYEGVYDSSVDSDILGLRPAIILKTTNPKGEKQMITDETKHITSSIEETEDLEALEEETPIDAITDGSHDLNQLLSFAKALGINTDDDDECDCGRNEASKELVDALTGIRSELNSIAYALNKIANK